MLPDWARSVLAEPYARWLLGGASASAITGMVIRPRLIVEFDPNDPLCNEYVGVQGTSNVAIAVRVRVRHVFGRAAKGCHGKLVVLRRYGSDVPEESGGQPLPWRDRDSSAGIRLKMGDAEYVNVASVMLEQQTRMTRLITDTPRGGKRVQSLPSGVYHCTVAVDADKAMSPVAKFGFFFSETPQPRREGGQPVFFVIPGSIERTPIWRVCLGF